jgi:hypothetical protein
MSADGATNGLGALPIEEKLPSRFGARWHLVGAGLSNVWRFGNVDLLSPSGRLLLRGQNGAGKTTALEALAPYLLDLNPARMAAGKSRTTNLNSLMREGAPGKRRYGYVWLTFAENQEGMWSFGARLQYSEGASPPVKVTPFAVLGRPLRDLGLHGPAGAPLSSDQFAENVIACGGEIFDEDGYVSHLAARVFGRADAKEVTELASRLRQVRNPAHSGDISPETAADALRDSLPGVDEGVISATADALAESDATRQAFSRDSEAADLLEDFRQAWCAHVTDVVRHCHDAANTAERERRAQASKVNECERAMKRASSSAAEKKAAVEALDSQIAATRSEIEAIEKHEDYKEAGRLSELQQTALARKQAATSAMQVMRGAAERSVSESASLAGVLQSLAEDLTELQSEAAATGTDAGSAGSLLSWAVRSRAPLKAGDNVVECGPEIQIHSTAERLREIADSWLRTAEQRLRQSEAAALAISDYKDVKQLKNEANEKALAAQRTRSASDQESARATRADADTRQASTTLIDEMRIWLRNHLRLLLPIVSAAAEPMGSSATSLNLDDLDQTTGQEPAFVLRTCDELTDEAVVSAEAAAGALRARATQANEKARQHRETARTLRAEAAELRAGRLLPMPRPDWAGPGNDDVALGTVLEWHQGLEDPTECALLEAAMSAAGLLGASIGEDGARTSRWEVKPTGPVCSGNLQEVVSVDVSHAFASQAAEVLARISLADTALQLDTPLHSLRIGRDGTFAAGVLHGRVPGADDHALLFPATHVGARQRRAAALARAELLEHEADSAEQEAITEETIASSLQADARSISDSARAAPSREDLRTKESQRAAIARNAIEARTAAEEAETAAQQAAEQFQTAQNDWLERTRGKGLPDDLDRLEELRVNGKQAAAALRRVAQRMSGKLAERLERTRRDYSPESTTKRLQEAEGLAKQAHHAAADSQRQVEVLEETAGAAIAEIQTRHALAEEHLSNRLALHEPTQSAWIDAERAEGGAREAVEGAAKQLREESEPRAREKLAALRAILGVHGVMESLLDGEPLPDDENLLTQVAARTQGRRTLTIKTVLEKADNVRAKLAGIWSLDPGDSHGELITFVLRYRDGAYTPTDAATYAQRLKVRAESALQLSEERALREFVIGRLPTAIGTAWTRLHDWLVDVNRKMQAAAASSGVSVQVRIPLRDDLPPACRDVYELSCKRSSAERTPEEQQQLGQALRALIESAVAESMQDRVAYAVDIREWVDVHYEVTRPGGTKQRWTRRTGLSSGERRLVMLAPMLAAIAATYDRFGPKVLRLVTLDEVPAEVDERGREGLARYIAALDLDLICTSYLWDGAPGAWDGIEAYDLEAGDEGTVVAFPMLVRGTSIIPDPDDPEQSGPGAFA